MNVRIFASKLKSGLRGEIEGREVGERQEGWQLLTPTTTYPAPTSPKEPLLSLCPLLQVWAVKVDSKVYIYQD